MKRAIALLAAIAVTVAPGAALAAPLTATKTATVQVDAITNPGAKSLPGALVDYQIVFTNPSANALTPVRNVIVEDVLPANVVMRVSDLVSGKGPIEFMDGSLLGTGLFGSGLSCTFVSYASLTDCFDFYNGTSWSYVPVPDSNGYDANVRAIRVKPVTTFSAGGSFQVRFRVKIR